MNGTPHADPAVDLDTDSVEHIKDILRAVSDQDPVSLQRFLDNYSFKDCKAVDVQDPTTGYSPLHAAVNATTSDGFVEDGAINRRQAKGHEIVQLLFENGAIWNQLDHNDETPGCIAHRTGQHDLYQLFVDAGVRAEMLLGRLEQYETLEDEDDTQEGELEDDQPRNDAPAIGDGSAQTDVNSSAYLASALSSSSRMLLDNQQNGVMMAWESGIMKQSADALLPRSGLTILNIGFGMGIIDSHIQDHPNKPTRHHIVEAHPDVLGGMQAKGWMDKQGVVVHAGKWQDVLPRLVGEGLLFDAIYFDTFAESYSDFRDFFSENVIGLLTEEGRWSFFNGMGADRQISYDVYQKVVEIDLFESGFDVEWEDVELPDLDGEWQEVRRKYWKVEQYRLPVCKFME